MRVVIVAGGMGTRMRPHTFSHTKALVNVAGKPVLGHILDELLQIPIEQVVFITGYLGHQIEPYVKEAYPDLKAAYVEQPVPLGQSHAIKLAAEYLVGPCIVMFADTLFEADLLQLPTVKHDGVAFVQPVADPARFGIAVPGFDGYVAKLVEKPQQPESDLAVIGLYYFREGEWLARAVNDLIERDIKTKGEFYLADAIQIMIDEGAKLSTSIAEVWEDTGTPYALLHSNRYLLRRHNQHGEAPYLHGSSVVIPPCYIHDSATLEQSIIGPYATINAGVTVRGSIVRNAIINAGAQLHNVALSASIVGEKASVRDAYKTLNVGDNSEVTAETSEEIDETFK